MSSHFLCAWSASSTNKHFSSGLNQRSGITAWKWIWEWMTFWDHFASELVTFWYLSVWELTAFWGLLCLGIDDIWGSLCLGNNALPGNWWHFHITLPGNWWHFGITLPGNWQHLGITLPENWHLGITLPGNWWHLVDVYDRLTRGSYLWKGTGKQVTCVHVANTQLKWSVHHLTLTLFSLGQTMELSRHPNLESTGIIFWTNPVHAQYELYSKSEHEWITQEWLCNCLTAHQPDTQIFQLYQSVICEAPQCEQI